MNMYHEHAARGIEALQKWYNPSRGLWYSTGWWNAAHALWVIIDYSGLTDTRTYEDVVRWTFERNRRGRFLNNFYDDEGWWALTWIKAYDVFGDPEYLAMAQTIFTDMEGGWDETCYGGIWWNKDRRYKNAVTNELFFTLAARLYLRVGDGGEDERSYLDWAQEAWGWFALSGMINAQNLVNDGLNDQCQNNGGETWTYNQGVLLGGLVDMYQITHDPAYLKQAQAIADATINTLVDQHGILREPCEPRCNADATQFKGIFVRNLAHLNAAEPDAAYKQFILNNAAAITQNNRTKDHQFGLQWTGPVDSADASRQSSALDAINAAIALVENS